MSDTGESRRAGYSKVTIFLDDWVKMRDENKRMRRDIGILISTVDFLSEATGETLDDEGVFDQIKGDYTDPAETEAGAS